MRGECRSRIAISIRSEVGGRPERGLSHFVAAKLARLRWGREEQNPGTIVRNVLLSQIFMPRVRQTERRPQSV